MGQQQEKSGNGAYALCDFLLGAVTARGRISVLPTDQVSDFDKTFDELERLLIRKTPLSHILLTRNGRDIPTVWGVHFEFKQQPIPIIVPLTRRLHSLVEHGTYTDQNWNGEGKYFLDLETGQKHFDGYQRTEPPLTHHPIYVRTADSAITLDEITATLESLRPKPINGEGYTM